MAVVFSDMIIEAQESSIFKVKLIIEEAKLFQQFEKDLNDRQKSAYDVYLGRSAKAVLSEV